MMCQLCIEDNKIGLEHYPGLAVSKHKGRWIYRSLLKGKKSLGYVHRFKVERDGDCVKIGCIRIAIEEMTRIAKLVS